MSANFRRLLASEWRKVTTTKLVWGLYLVALAFAVVNVVALVFVASGRLPGAPNQGNMLLNPEYMTTLLAQAGSASTFALVIGVVAMTGEYRHMTITSTYLSTPRRSRVLAAKMVLFGAVGALLAVIASAVVLVVLVVSLALLGLDHAPLAAGMVGSVLLGALIGLTLYAILGVSLGALIKNQVAAIIAVLVWVLLLEALVGLVAPAVAKWLPGGALNAAMDVGVRADASGALTQADRLPAWGGIAVLLAYAVVFALLAARTTLRRDIT